MFLNLEAIEFLYLFAAFHGVFLSSILLVNKKAFKRNTFLVLILFIFSYFLIEGVFSTSGYIRKVPHLYLTSTPLTFLVPPLFYYFISLSLNAEFKIKRIHLLYFLPFVYELIIYIPFYSLNSSDKLFIYEINLNRTFTHDIIPKYWIGFLIFILISIWFYGKSYLKLSNVRPKSQKSKTKVELLKKFTILLIIYYLFRVTLAIIYFFNPTLESFNFHFSSLGLVLIIHSIGYVAFLYPEVVRKEVFEKSLYKNSVLSDNEILKLKEKLILILEKQKAFLNDDLSPMYLADQLGISRNKLSQLLSKGFNSNFYELVNGYRIEEAKRMLSEERFRDLKLIHIALDCGFTNKSSFIRNFKNMTGKTPSEFKSKMALQN